MGARRAPLVLAAVFVVAGLFPGGADAQQVLPALIVGDSLTYAAADELQAEFSSAGYEATVRAVPGTGLVTHRDFWVAELRRLLREVDPAIVVLQFSGNHPEPWPTDSTGAEIRPESPAFADAWCATANELTGMAIASGARVSWVLNPPMEYPGPDAMTGLVDLITLGVARGWGDVGLIDWDAALANTDGGFARVLDGQQVRSDDGVHLAPAGELRAAVTTAAAVAAPVERLDRASPIQEALALSRRHFNAAADVVVASSLSPADALVAAPLAGHLNAPLLLVDPSGGNSTVAREISRLGVTEVTVVGGAFAMPAATVDEVAGSAAVARIAGADRYETAANVASVIEPSHAYIVRGFRDAEDSWTDALASASAAASRGGAILFANSAPLPPPIRSALERIPSATVAGGVLAVPAAVEEDVAAIGVAVDRAEGVDRFATAAVLFDDHDYSASTLEPVLVAGDHWSWGVAAAALKPPLHVVPASTLHRSPAALEALIEARPTSIQIVGGWGSVSTRVETELALLLRSA